MRLFERFTLVGSILFFVFSSLYSVPCNGQSDGFEDDYLVVIGAFSILNNAIAFTDHARIDCNLNANWAFNVNRSLYYVYIISTPDRSVAVNEAIAMRDKPEFADTWVYYGKIDQLNHQIYNKEHHEDDINPETEQSISNVTTQDPALMPDGVMSHDEALKINTVREASGDVTVDDINFMFKIYRSDDSSFVEGNVDVIDVERSRKIGTYKGNTVVKVLPPLSKSDSILAICNVFGFRKMQHYVNYHDPAGAGVTIDNNGIAVIPFELERLKKGDIAVMYNVYFFKDASIMRPESLFEINSLLELLNENEKYAIRIHGHTNGDSYGRLILQSDKDKNFFYLSNTVEGFGSAKKLSEERANAIKNYLITKGINANRMQIKAWGGKRPVHDKFSVRAQENVRVEIEIIDN